VIKTALGDIATAPIPAYVTASLLLVAAVASGMIAYRPGGEAVDLHPAGELERLRTLYLAALSELQSLGLLKLGDSLSEASES